MGVTRGVECQAAERVAAVGPAGESVDHGKLPFVIWAGRKFEDCACSVGPADLGGAVEVSGGVGG